MRTFLIHSMLAFVALYVFYHQEAPPVKYTAYHASVLFWLLIGLLWLSAWFYNKPYFRKLPKAISFALYFIKELLLANLKIAFDILTPSLYMHPAVIALPLSVTTDLEITALSIVMSLTPGTLSIDVSEDKKVLYLHALYARQGDEEAVKQQIKNGFERRIIELYA